MLRRLHLALAVGLMLSLFAGSLSVAAQEDEYQEFATDEFHEVWERTDYPVQQLETARTWIWGPGAISSLLTEDYAEAEDGARQVQYSDKSRMEMPGNGGDEDSPWFISQGLLATELMTGRLQLGDDTFEQYQPAEIPVAGDPDDAGGPTYAVMGVLMNDQPRADGETITEVLTADGTTFDNPDLDVHGVTAEYFVEETGNYVASPFWDFMTSQGTIYEDGELTEGDIFEDPFYAVGFPTTPAYWAWVKVDEVHQNVLVQCFERRCLTYTPNNPEGWEVESANIGRHYQTWRYDVIADQEPITETAIELEPADAENPYIGPQGIEEFEANIEDAVIAEIGEDEWDDIPEDQQQEILDENIEDFWMNAIGEPAPDQHSVEVTVTENGETVESGTVDVLVEDVHGDHVLYEDEVEIEDGVATFGYGVAGHASLEEPTTNTVTVSYGEDTEAEATVTWVPFLQYDYEQEPTYLSADYYFNQETDEPAEAVGETGDWFDFIATLLDQFGQPIEGEALSVSVDGVNPDPSETTSYNPANIDTAEWDPDPWDGETNEDGQRAFSYVGEDAGEDEVRIEVEADPDVSVTLPRTWEEAEE